MAKSNSSNVFGGGVAHNSLVSRLLTTLQSYKFDINSFPGCCKINRRSTSLVSLCTEAQPSVRGLGWGNYKKKAAFTLAEILITIGVIGIVAAMTIPGLMTKIEEKVLINQLWQTYNIVHNATRQMLAEEVGTMDVRLLSADSSKAYHTWEELLPKYLKVTHRCETWKSAGVCNGKNYKKYGNQVYNSSVQNYKTYVLSNGATVIFQPSVTIGSTYNKCNSTVSKLGVNGGNYFNGCGAFHVDVNGKKGPNLQGKDMFRFYLVRDGIIPDGSKQETVWTQTFKDGCMKNNGESCAAWALYNKNMDYLRCKDDLSWDGNKTCPKK